MDLAEVLRNYPNQTPVTAKQLEDDMGPLGRVVAKDLGKIKHVKPPKGYPTPLKPDARWYGYNGKAPDMQASDAHVENQIRGLNNPNSNSLPQEIQQYTPDLTAKAPIQWRKEGEPTTLAPGESLHYDADAEATDTVGHELMHGTEEFEAESSRMAKKTGHSKMDIEHYLIDELRKFNKTGKGALAGFEHDMGARLPGAMTRQDYLRLRGQRK